MPWCGPMLLILAVVTDAAGPVDFDTEIIPILTKAGCNAGACHGAAAGRGGFRLSLFGGDPAADQHAIAHELEGRRVNIAHPDDSLLLAKPTGMVDHGGGFLFEADSPSAQRLQAWIAGGAMRAPRSRNLTHFQVHPQPTMTVRIDETISLHAVARFDQGPDEDVTAGTLFTATDPSALRIDPVLANLQLLRHGQHVLIARFLDRVIPVQLVVPFGDAPADPEGRARVNFIDDHVLNMLAAVGLTPSPAADDATYLRRVRLDLTGRLPSRDEVEQFLEDRAVDKHLRLVDRLLASPDFVEYWTFMFARLYRNRNLPGETAGAAAFHQWLTEQIQCATPLDHCARNLIVAEGDANRYGPAHFVRLSGDARAQAELVAQVFLGVRLQCASCHNHPLDCWTRDDYHGLAAVFARVDRGPVVGVSQRGAVTNPRTGEPAVPRIPGQYDLDPAGDPRAAFAAWLTAQDNPYFARAIVNRLWRSMLGRGLVEPADDLRDTNPATHPELLNRLAADFVANGCDLRHTLRLIATSATYGRSSTATETNKRDDRFYSHANVRGLEPEVLVDAWSDVVGVADSYEIEPLGTRAIALIDPSTPSLTLDALGRCSRRASCEAQSGGGGGLGEILHRVNGEAINRKLAAPGGRLQCMLREDAMPESILVDFYLRALCRFPTDRELAHWHAEAAALDQPQQAEWLEDVIWSLLNSKEFTTNH